MTKPVALLSSIFVLLCILVIFVQAIPELPMIVAGQAYINGRPAPQGTEIVAKNSDILLTKTTTGSNGTYSLLIQSVPKGTPVDFYVDNTKTPAQRTYTSGDFQSLDLQITVSVLPKILKYSMFIIGGGAVLIIGSIAFILWKFKHKKKSERGF